MTNELTPQFVMNEMDAAVKAFTNEAHAASVKMRLPSPIEGRADLYTNYTARHGATPEMVEHVVRKVEFIRRHIERGLVEPMKDIDYPWPADDAADLTPRVVAWGDLDALISVNEGAPQIWRMEFNKITEYTRVHSFLDTFWTLAHGTFGAGIGHIVQKVLKPANQGKAAPVSTVQKPQNGHNGQGVQNPPRAGVQSGVQNVTNASFKATQENMLGPEIFDPERYKNHGYADKSVITFLVTRITRDAEGYKMYSDSDNEAWPLRMTEAKRAAVSSKSGQRFNEWAFKGLDALDIKQGGVRDGAWLVTIKVARKENPENGTMSTFFNAYRNQKRGVEYFRAAPQ